MNEHGRHSGARIYDVGPVCDSSSQSRVPTYVFDVKYNNGRGSVVLTGYNNPIHLAGNKSDIPEYDIFCVEIPVEDLLRDVHGQFKVIYDSSGKVESTDSLYFALTMGDFLGDAAFFLNGK